MRHAGLEIAKLLNVIGNIAVFPKQGTSVGGGRPGDYRYGTFPVVIRVYKRISIAGKYQKKQH